MGGGRGLCEWERFQIVPEEGAEGVEENKICQRAAKSVREHKIRKGHLIEKWVTIRKICA